MGGRAYALAALIVGVVMLLGLPTAAAETPQYTTIVQQKLSAGHVGCVDVAWAAGQGLIQPVEVRWLDGLGINCPDDTVTREGVPSDQYVVMLALATHHQLTCADIEWNAAYGYLTWSAAINLTGLVGGCTLSRYASMVTLLSSGRLTCEDVDWNLNNGFITSAEAGWLRAPIICKKSLGSLLQQLVGSAPNWGVQLSAIAVEDLRTGERWSANGDQQMSFNSAAKFPWAIMATAAAGTSAVEPYAASVFVDSDNIAAGALIDLAGGIDRINSYWYPALGMSRSCLQRWNYGTPREFSGNCGYAYSPVFDYSNGHEFYNYDTPDDMTTVLDRFWSGRVPGLDAAGRAKLLEWSTWPAAAWAPDGQGTMTGYLPPWTWPSAHHKIGWYFDPFLTASDVGIIDLPGTTYALAMAAYGGQSSAAQAQFLALASCEIYRSMNQDGAWSCSPPAS